jgi:activator of 2-hydroxyglutaryl-CoA dehydratase
LSSNTRALDETRRSQAVTHLDSLIKINHSKNVVGTFFYDKNVKIAGIMSAQYVLGIDVGTTSVKVNLIDIATKKAIARQTKDTRADCPSELGPAAGNKQVRTVGDRL